MEAGLKRKLETWERLGYESFGAWRRACEKARRDAKKAAPLSTASSQMASAADQRPGCDLVGQQHSLQYFMDFSETDAGLPYSLWALSDSSG